MPARPPNQGYGPFEAFSIAPSGRYLRTFHRTARAAQRRLDGNPRHRDHKVIDHRPLNAETGKREWIWLNPPKGASA